MIMMEKKSKLLAHILSHANSMGRSQTPCHLCSGENMLICVGGGNHSPESSGQGGMIEHFNSLNVRSYRSCIKYQQVCNEKILGI